MPSFYIDMDARHLLPQRQEVENAQDYRPQQVKGCLFSIVNQLIHFYKQIRADSA